MSFQQLVNQIAQHPDIISRPPVLLDIGASGYLNPEWRLIAPFSIGIVCDADSREFGYIENSSSLFKKLVVVNKIVTDKTDNTDTSNFFLTRSPYCSSLLSPKPDSLAKYYFSEAFEVVKKVNLPIIGLQDALNSLNIDNIDWFKSDSQGIDLRLFKSLNTTIRDRIIVAEFEPGFIDAYEGEDKVSDLLAFMKTQQFSLTKFIVKGPVEIQANHFKQVFNNGVTQKLAKAFAKGVPGWAEIGYISTADKTIFNEREYLLSWLFATVQNNHDVALSFAKKGLDKFNLPIYQLFIDYSTKKLRQSIWSFSHLPRLFQLVFKRIIGS
jgi:hypothetical protein